SASNAATSDANPQVRGASWTTTQRPVRRTESSTASSSSGLSVRRSRTSTDASPASASAARSQTPTIAPQPTSVASVPARQTRRAPSGTMWSPSGTVPRDVRYTSFGSRTTTGSGSRIAAASSPFASAGGGGAGP